MILVGINVTKDKHVCFIMSKEAEVFANVFAISNSSKDFDCLLQRIRDCFGNQEKIKVEFEVTEYCSYNIFDFFLAMAFSPMLESLAHQSPSKSFSL